MRRKTLRWQNGNIHDPDRCFIYLPSCHPHVPRTQHKIQSNDKVDTAVLSTDHMLSLRLVADGPEKGKALKLLFPSTGANQTGQGKWLRFIYVSTRWQSHTGKQGQAVASTSIGCKCGWQLPPAWEKLSPPAGNLPGVTSISLRESFPCMINGSNKPFPFPSGASCVGSRPWNHKGARTPNLWKRKRAYLA